MDNIMYQKYHNYIRLNNPGRIKASLNIFLQASLFQANVHQLVTFILQISCSIPSINPSINPSIHDGLSNLYYSDLCIFHDFLGHLITVYCSKRANASQSSYFNICDNIRSSINFISRYCIGTVILLSPGWAHVFSLESFFRDKKY